MDKKFSFSITLMILTTIGFATIAIASGEKSAREICFRKCSESMDKSFDKPGMTRVACAKQHEECIESCEELLAE